jgi:hypothetical protein
MLNTTRSDIMIQHYRNKQRQYLQWRTGQQGEKQEESCYISPHLRQLRTDWFAKRYEKYAREDGQEREAHDLPSIRRCTIIPSHGGEAELHSSHRASERLRFNKTEIDGEDKRAGEDKDR